MPYCHNDLLGSTRKPRKTWALNHLLTNRKKVAREKKLVDKPGYALTLPPTPEGPKGVHPHLFTQLATAPGPSLGQSE
jgi:hypothetical protein